MESESSEESDQSESSSSSEESSSNEESSVGESSEEGVEAEFSAWKIRREEFALFLKERAEQKQSGRRHDINAEEGDDSRQSRKRLKDRGQSGNRRHDINAEEGDDSRQSRKRLKDREQSGNRLQDGRQSRKRLKEAKKKKKQVSSADESEDDSRRSGRTPQDEKKKKKKTSKGRGKSTNKDRPTSTASPREKKTRTASSKEKTKGRREDSTEHKVSKRKGTTGTEEGSKGRKRVGRTEEDRESEGVSEDDEAMESERKIYTYPTLDHRMVRATTKQGAGERAIAATVIVRTQPRAKWHAHMMDLKYDWRRFWTFLNRLSMDIEGEETGPGFDGKQLRELRALWSLPVFRTQETVQEITTWAGWQRRDYTGTTLRDFIYDTEEQPAWGEAPTTGGATILMATCERLGKVLGILCSKHFRSSFGPLRRLQNRKYGNIADAVLHHVIHEGISAFALDITTLRKTSGPRGNSGQPIDTPKRAAKALKAYMEESVARIERGTKIHDSTATSPHLFFFRSIAPTIKGYETQPRGHSYNQFGIGGRDAGAQAVKRQAMTPMKELDGPPKDGSPRPCMWHVASVSPLLTKAGGKFTCKNQNCKLSHATKTLDDITPAPTKTDLRGWDASGALKTSLAEVAKQLHTEWI